MSELQGKAERIKPLFERMERFIDFCESAVDRAFARAGLYEFVCGGVDGHANQWSEALPVQCAANNVMPVGVKA